MRIHTAQILVGHPDAQGWPGGINPTHIVWISENGAPAYVLERWEPHWAAGGWYSPAVEEPITWIPSRPEHALEDALLLIAVHVVRDEVLLQIVRERCPELAASRADLADVGGDFPDLGDVDNDVLDELRERCSRLEWRFKLVITIFQGSMLARQQHVLEKYGMALEVCSVNYFRPNAADGGEVWGSLAPPVPWD